MLAHEIVDGVIGVDRFPGIAPEPLENLILHLALGDEPVVDIRDLQLTAAGWLEPGMTPKTLAG